MRNRFPPKCTRRCGRSRACPPSCLLRPPAPSLLRCVSVCVPPCRTPEYVPRSPFRARRDEALTFLLYSFHIPRPGSERQVCSRLWLSACLDSSTASGDVFLFFLGCAPWSSRVPDERIFEWGDRLRGLRLFPPEGGRSVIPWSARLTEGCNCSCVSVFTSDFRAKARPLAVPGASMSQP